MDNSCITRGIVRELFQPQQCIHFDIHIALEKQKASSSPIFFVRYPLTILLQVSSSKLIQVIMILKTVYQ